MPAPGRRAVVGRRRAIAGKCHVAAAGRHVALGLPRVSASVRGNEAHPGEGSGHVTPFCQRHHAEPIAAWHRRIHATAHDWRDAAEFLVLRGLHAEAKMVTSVAHMRREERTVALMGVAEERDREARDVIVRAYPQLTACSALCVWEGAGPCDCPAPEELHRLRQRARALRWAAEALMRPEPRLMPPPAGEKDVVDRLQDAIDAVERRLADQMTERAGGLARSAVTSTK